MKCCVQQESPPKIVGKIPYRWFRYLFIGPNRGQNSVHGLPLKWAPTFLVTFLLLPNLRVRIYVDSTKIMSVRRNGGKSKQLPKLVSMGCDGLTPWSAGGGSLVPTPW
jgi:hypothetical protein